MVTKRGEMVGVVSTLRAMWGPRYKEKGEHLVIEELSLPLVAEEVILTGVNWAETEGILHVHLGHEGMATQPHH